MDEDAEDGSSEELDKPDDILAEPRCTVRRLPSEVFLSLASHIMSLSQSLKLLICFQCVDACILSLVFECL